MAIHPTAVVSPEAVIGRNVTIGPYSVVEDHVTIGNDCHIDAHVKIARHTSIGDRSRIYFGSLIGEEPQDHRFKPGTVAYTQIGSDTTIREYVTIHRSPFENGCTRVGDHTLLMAFVHVGHDAQIGNYVTCANHTAISGHVIIEDGAVLSGYIMIHQFCRIGALAMLAAGSKIRQDVPPYCMLSENSFICGANIVGMRRAGLESETRSAIRRAIKIYFFKGLNGTNAIGEIRAKADTPETGKFIKFIQDSTRGIVDPDPDLLAIGLHRNLEDED